LDGSSIKEVRVGKRAKISYLHYILSIKFKLIWRYVLLIFSMLIPTFLGCGEKDNNTEPPEVVNPNDIDDDGDGVTENQGDCDDNDSSLGAISEDADCDGVTTDEDCDDNDPAVLSNESDKDCDGVSQTDDCDDDDPDLLDQAQDQDCDGFETTNDCDDDNADVHPGAAEICDGLDNDCDPTTFALPSEEDADLDGSLACLDCDDTNPNLYPGNVESFDILDNDCNDAIETTVSMTMADMSHDSIFDNYNDAHGCTAFLPYVDLTEDGHDEIVLACSNQDDMGKVFILDGFTTLNSQTIDTQAAIITISNEGSNEFGIFVDLLSDMDGDNKKELFVAGEHQSFVFSSLELETGGSFTTENARLQIGIGRWSNNNNTNPIQIGDVDDDGLQDLLIGSHVFRGSTLELNILLSSSDADIQFSTSSNQDSIDAIIHDMNGDGIDDILFSDQEYNPREDGWYTYYAGVVIGYFGGVLADGIWNTENADFQIVGDNDEDSELGRQIGVIDDISGDGHAEILVGRRSWNGSQGWLYLIPSEELIDGEMDYESFNLQYKLTSHTDDIFPSEILSIGDLDGDGLGDVMMLSEDALRADLFFGAELVSKLYLNDWDYYEDISSVYFPICTNHQGNCWRSNANIVDDINGDGHRELILSYGKDLTSDDQFVEGFYVFFGPQGL
jgi:hypothetical protein